jgi:hypothetical protein
VLTYHRTRHTHQKADAATVRPMIEQLRADRVFAKAEAVVAAARRDPWVVLSGERAASCDVLRRVGRVAREVENPLAWATALDGAEYATLSEFIQHASPLILVLRLTPLRVEGPERPYNGDKAACGQSVLNALNTRVVTTVKARLRLWRRR